MGKRNHDILLAREPRLPARLQKIVVHLQSSPLVRGRFGHFAADAFCALQERATVFSQHQFTRGTMYQRRADSALEFCQTLAGNRFRNLQAPRRLADRTDFAVVTKPSRDSSFSIVRFYQTLAPLIAV